MVQRFDNLNVWYSIPSPFTRNFARFDNRSREGSLVLGISQLSLDKAFDNPMYTSAARHQPEVRIFLHSTLPVIHHCKQLIRSTNNCLDYIPVFLIVRVVSTIHVQQLDCAIICWLLCFLPPLFLQHAQKWTCWRKENISLKRHSTHNAKNCIELELYHKNFYYVLVSGFLEHPKAKRKPSETFITMD